MELWHPIGADPNVVLSWRQRLSELRITQPFKQCHREIYVLTDAERETNTYSNRFAGHIVKQHQLQALCSQRGWQYRLMGAFDSFNVPTIELPRWNLAVEFFVEDPHGRADNTRSGIYSTVSTDKVQFSRCIERELDAYVSPFHKRVNSMAVYRYEAAPLTEIMPIVFSELMRDVDLFVSVCSIGADPNWNQEYRGNQEPRGNQGYGEYWLNFAFGDLDAAATTRKSVLRDLLPSLTIYSKCKIEDNFLVVKGELRTYKIHLASGNILMEPNNQYLCIVPAAGLTHHQEQLFLPFEGDSMLSVIISKAVMLANDTKIKDPSILSQIKSKGQ